MDEKLKENICRKDTWIRGLYMLLFVVIYGITKALIAFIMIFQFLSALLTGKTNEQLVRLGQKVSTFSYQIIMFFTYNSEEKPFPFSPWPEGPPDVRKTGVTSEDARKGKTSTKPKSATKKKKKIVAKPA